MSKILLKRILQKISITLLWCFFLQLNASAENGIPVDALSYGASYADEVTGKVTELSGKPLLDVIVQIKGRPNSLVLTDVDGKFMLKADRGDVLIFKVNGFKTQEIAFNGQKEINVTLLEDDSPSDTFNVLYTKQKKATNLESVSEIRTNDLTKTISSPIYGTLTGRLAGLSTYQSSGVVATTSFKVVNSTLWVSSNKTLRDDCIFL